MVWKKPDFGGTTQQKLNVAKVGVVSFYKAAVGTPFDAALSWLFMGRAKAGTDKTDFSRKFYDLMTGVPETTKESFVIGIEGKTEITLIEPTSDVYSMAVGNTQKFPSFVTTNVPVAVADVTLAGSTTKVVHGTAVAGFAIGDEIEINDAGVKRYTRIIAIDPIAETYDVYPVLSGAPAAGAAIKVIQQWEFGMGGSLVEHFSMRFITDYTDGSQSVVWVNEARSDGLKPSKEDGKKEISFAMTFTLFGYSDAAYTGPIVAKQYLLTKAAAIIPD